MALPCPDMFGGYRVVGTLGEGSFSKVYKAEDRETHKIYAIKQLKTRFRSLNEVNQISEIPVLRALQNHPNIVKLEDVLFDSKEGHLALVFERLDLNLFELIEQNGKPFNEKTALIIGYQLLKAVAHLHDLGFFHRDIKPENAMVDRQTLELKLVDMGSTRQTSARGPFTEYISTRWYRAPECLLTAGSYGPAVDVWAVGCVIYEIMTSRPLFPGKNEIDQIGRIHNILGTPSRNVLARFGQNPNKQIDFAFPHRGSQDLATLIPFAHPNVADLLKGMLAYSPIDRMTATDALEHPAFESLRVGEEEWIADGCRGPMSAFLLGITLPPPKRTIMRPVLIPGTYTYELRPQEVLAATEPVTVQRKIKANDFSELEQLAGKTTGKELLEARKKAADRIKEHNRRHIIATKPKRAEQSLVLGPARLAHTKLMQPLQRVVGHQYAMPYVGIVRPRLPRLA